MIQNGRNFVEEDYTGFRKVALLDDTAVQTLFPGENPVERLWKSRRTLYGGGKYPEGREL